MIFCTNHRPGIFINARVLNRQTTVIEFGAKIGHSKVEFWREEKGTFL